MLKRREKISAFVDVYVEGLIVIFLSQSWCWYVPANAIGFDPPIVMSINNQSFSIYFCWSLLIIPPYGLNIKKRRKIV